MKKLLFLFIPLLLVSCSNHDDLPQAVDVTPPPVPTSFTVQMPTVGVYELDWDVADPGQVSYYKIYIFDPFAGPTELDQTTVSEYYYEFPIPVTEVIWGVSAVSLDNLESGIVYGLAPSL